MAFLDPGSDWRMNSGDSGPNSTDLSIAYAQAQEQAAQDIANRPEFFSEMGFGEQGGWGVDPFRHTYLTQQSAIGAAADLMGEGYGAQREAAQQGYAAMAGMMQPYMGTAIQDYRAGLQGQGS